MTVRVVCAWIEQPSGQILLAQRPPMKHLASLWEFPGGKIEAGESADRALKRELKEELDIDAEVGAEIAHATHDYGEVCVELVLLRVTGYSGKPKPLEAAALSWVDRQWLRDNAHLMPAADRPLVAAALSWE